MCGIAGIFDPEPGRPTDQAALRRMTDALAHRGPDGDGFHIEPGIGLGHRRLSIIDIAGGGQPMFNEDGSVAIVFNGEIYNFQDLRDELLARGHVFANRCDTEAIVHAWEEWGTDCLNHLSGMFAFALWDRNRGQLLLARDRFGKKPIYHATLPDGRLVFASEMAALTTHPEIARRIDPQSVEDFFAYGFIPDPATIYQGVHRLAAGHFLLIGRDGRPAMPRRWWRVRIEAGSTPTPADAAAELRRKLHHAVASRMVADVPLGAFLSGGIDSSAVVAVAAGLRDTPLSTFTIGFGGSDDERPYARMMAERYRTDHREEAATLDYIDAARAQARMFGEPFGDSSSVPTHQVCALARRHVTVALSGDGGDEAFAGYRRHRWHQLTEAVRALLPAPLRAGVIGSLARVYPKLDRAPRWLRAKYTLTELSLDSAMGYYRTLCKVHDERRRALLSAQTRAALDGHDPSARVAALMEECGAADPVLQAQYVDLNLYLPGDILTKVDRASMATSLEVRAPLLDHDLVGWAASLPSALKLRGRQGKLVFREALQGMVPDAILNRAKQGFAVSLSDQLRAGAERVRARLLGPAMLECGLFDRTQLTRLVDEHAAAAFDHSAMLWLLLVFEGFLHNEAAAKSPVAEQIPA
jgi:asparagine synthase (glutamine-hydrolysing)